jgi:signal transduction histidine kinase/CheY-like chemotaxis protein
MESISDDQDRGGIGPSRDVDQLALLSQVSEVLSSSLDFKEMLRQLERALVPRLADGWSVHTLSPTGAIERLIAAHVDPAKLELSDELNLKYPVDPFDLVGLPTVLRTGKSELYQGITDEQLAEYARDEEHLRLLRLLDLAAVLMVPMRAAGATLGAIMLLSGPSKRAFTEAERAVAELIGLQAGAALERARLLEIAEAERHRASEAIRAKDEFLSIVSHELRTPLNAILGWTRMLRTGKLNEEKRDRGFETIERSVKAQAQLIGDLVDLSRMISGKVHLSVERVHIGRIVEAAANVVRPAADAKGVRLELRIDPEAGMIMGDAERLQQVLWNLLTNAVKFTPNGGAVVLRLRKTSASVEIAVEDTGEGIAPDHLPLVFERFHQAQTGAARPHGGLGLGLAIVRHLVELHCGRVEARSEGAGLGATFLVHLPVSLGIAQEPASIEAEPPHTDSLSPVSRPAGLRGLRVVIVDDEPDARELLASIFEYCEAKAMVAGDARAALMLVREARPDVLVSDIGLPGEDGYSLIEKIRALPPEEGGRTHAVALTAFARIEDRVRALEAGYDVHIAKPIEPSVLLTVVASLAERRRPS